MATGTTSDQVIKRDELIKDALWHVRALPPDGRVSVDLLRRTVRILNNVIRQEDIKLTGDNKALWALDFAALFIVANQHTYGVAEGLRPDAQYIERIQFRSTSGDDTDVAMMSQHSFDALDNKNEIGDTENVLIRPGRLTKDQQWTIHPVKNSITATNEVLYNGKNYQCVQGHTSAVYNSPESASGKLYWQEGGSDGTAWADATAYTNGELLYYSFKRPLYDFTSPYDNPDMPQGWENYLTYTLALNLTVGRDLPQKDISMLVGLRSQAETDIFGSKQVRTTDHHNKADYF